MSVQRSHLLIINVYPSTKGADSVITMARALVRTGHRVDIIMRRDNPRDEEVSCPAVGVRITRLDVGPAVVLDEDALLRLVPAFVAAAWRTIRLDGPFDLMHSHRLISGLVAQRLKESLGLPLVASFDVLGLSSSPDRLPNDPIAHIRADVERRVMAHADRIVAQCAQQLTDLTRLYGIEERRLCVVPPGVDVRVFQPQDRLEMRRRLELDPDEFVIVHASKLEPHKGIDNIIRAVGLQRSDVRARLLVVGSEPSGGNGNESRRLAGLAHRCGIADQVSFVGQLTQYQLACHFAAADVAVDTPWYEPLGDSPLEAMACGAPVIASDVGGAADTVSDGVTGFLVRPRDPQGLAGRIEQLHRNPALAQALGRAGILRARSIFGWDHIAEQLADAYHAVETQAPFDGVPTWAAPLLNAEWLSDGVPVHSIGNLHAETGSNTAAKSGPFDWQHLKPGSKAGFLPDSTRAGAEFH